MRVVKIGLLGLALMASATGFSQKTKMVTKMVLDSIQEGDKKWSFSYDKRGNNTQSINHSTGIVIEYTYDANGKLMESYHGKSTKVEYTYDDTENTMLGIWYQRDGNGWKKNGVEIEYTYDENGNLIIVRIRRNGACSTVSRERHEYKYNAKGNLTEHCRYQGLDEEDEDIRPQEKWEYTYDANGITGEIQSVHASAVGWQLGKKYEYTCDYMGNVIKSISYSRFGGEWRYDGTAEYEYTYYDLPDSEIEVVLPYDKEDYQLKGVVTEKRANYTDKVDYYHWSPKEIEVESKSVNISELTQVNSSIKVYPNPTGGQLKVEIAGQSHNDGTDIVLFDITGKNVGTWHTVSAPSETVIDISHLANGIYFLKLNGEMYKVVKQ